MLNRVLKLLLLIVVVCSLTACTRQTLDVAIANGDIQTVKRIISTGYSPDEVLTHGYTSVHIAVISDQPEILSYLISEGGDINAVSLDGAATPLILSAFNSNHDTLKVLLDAGVSVNNQLGDGSSALLCLVAAGDCAGARLVIEAGADPDIKDAEGWTPLHLTAGYGNIEMVRLLLDAGADPKWLTLSGNSASEIARTNGHDEIAEILDNSEGSSLLEVE